MCFCNLLCVLKRAHFMLLLKIWKLFPQDRYKSLKWQRNGERRSRKLKTARHNQSFAQRNWWDVALVRGLRASSASKKPCFLYFWGLTTICFQTIFPENNLVLLNVWGSVKLRHDIRTISAYSVFIFVFHSAHFLSVISTTWVQKNLLHHTHH